MSNTFIIIIIHSFNSPAHPDDHDWSNLYPILKTDKSKGKVEFLDVGCGYGGLLGKYLIHQFIFHLTIKLHHIPTF